MLGLFTALCLFDVFRPVTSLVYSIKINLIGDITSCGLVEVYRLFRGQSPPRKGSISVGSESFVLPTSFASSRTPLVQASPLQPTQPPDLYKDYTSYVLLLPTGWSIFLSTVKSLGAEIAQSVYQRATGWTIGVQLLAGTRNFSLLRTVKFGSEAHTVSYQWLPVTLLSGIKVTRA
jgi:hypothetical protein